MSFFLSVAVTLGFPHEGGVYPEGGPQAVARTLVERIEDDDAVSKNRHSPSRVYTRAPVKKILLNGDETKVTGVKLANGKDVMCHMGVVSACGWRNTRRLAPSVFPHDIPVAQGDGFVMVNVGIKGRNLQLECCNFLPQPGGGGQSMFDGIQNYLNDPLGVPVTEIRS